MKRLVFSGIPFPIELHDCDDLAGPMADFFRAWPFTDHPGDADPAPIITVRRDAAGGYLIGAPWLATPIAASGAVDALRTLSVDLVNAFFRARPGSHCLHGAAAEFSDRLVVFPDTGKAGKSLLMAGLAHDGIAIYGDDLLAVTPYFHGMSFGIPPRLCKPLPAGEPELASFVRRSVLIEDGRHCYLDGQATHLAAFGSKKPIGAIVVLDRGDGGDAALTPAESSLGLQTLVRQQFLREGEALQLLDFSTLLAQNIPCWVLSYSSVSGAVSLLWEAFSGPSTYGYKMTDYAAAPFATPKETTGKRASAGSTKRLSKKRYRQVPGITMRIEDGSIFLVDGDGSSIYQTNAAGRIVWKLLEEAVAMPDVADALAEAFPDEPRDRIRGDVRTIFDDLKDNGLIAMA